MAENDAPELKPCPFCGAKAAIYYHGGDGALQASDQVDVGCSSMDGCAVGPRIAADPENEQWAIKTWNTRGDLAAPNAAQWSDRIPKANGFYWVQQGDYTPYIVEFEDGFAFFTGVERCSDHFSNDHRFLGPLHPSCLPNDQAWRNWFDRLGDKATAEVVNATANLVTDERLAALVDARVLPTAEPDAVRQARRDDVLGENLRGILYQATLGWIEAHPYLKSKLEQGDVGDLTARLAAALRAEGEKGESKW